MPLSLGRYPTPVFQCKSLCDDGSELWVKDDSVSGDAYGGNKVRKLERILAVPRVQQASRLVTAGAAGSHFALALSVYGRREGRSVEAWLWPHPASDHAAGSLRQFVAQEGKVRIARSATGAIARALAEAAADRRAVFIAPGGAGLEATCAYVAAVAELRSQLIEMERAPPAAIVVACGTGGTAAGLLVGLFASRLPSALVAIPIARNVSARLQILAQAVQAARALSLPVGIHDLSRRLIVEHRFAGRGYGWPTELSSRALDIGRRVGILLDPTYTAKAFAGALATAGLGGFCPPDEKVPVARPIRTLYWHTLSRAYPESRLEGAPTVDEVRRSYSALFISPEN